MAASKSSPLQIAVANVNVALIPIAPVAIITPLTASKVIDSTVPNLAIFFACSYVKFPFLTISLAFDGSLTPGTSPFLILFSIALTAASYLSDGTSICIGVPSEFKYLNFPFSKHSEIHFEPLAQYLV